MEELYISDFNIINRLFRGSWNTKSVLRRVLSTIIRVSKIKISLNNLLFFPYIIESLLKGETLGKHLVSLLLSLLEVNGK